MTRPDVIVQYLDAAINARRKCDYVSALRTSAEGILWALEHKGIEASHVFLIQLQAIYEQYKTGVLKPTCNFCARKSFQEGELVFGHGGGLCKDCYLKLGALFDKMP